MPIEHRSARIDDRLARPERWLARIDRRVGRIAHRLERIDEPSVPTARCLPWIGQALIGPDVAGPGIDQRREPIEEALERIDHSLVPIHHHEGDPAIGNRVVESLC